MQVAAVMSSDAIELNLLIYAMTMPRMTASDSDDNFAYGCVIFFFVGAIWWLGYTFFYAPYHRDPTGIPPLPDSKSDTRPLAEREIAPMQSVQLALLEVLGSADPRLEILHGGNLEVYLTRAEFERIPFPDRTEAVTSVGKAWCSNIAHTYLPSVRFRDIRTGEEFASYGCVSRRASISGPR